jgi:hypothetical protein
MTTSTEFQKCKLLFWLAEQILIHLSFIYSNVNIHTNVFGLISIIIYYLNEQPYSEKIIIYPTEFQDALEFCSIQRIKFHPRGLKGTKQNLVTKIIILILRHVTLCTPVEVNWRFGRTNSLLLGGLFLDLDFCRITLPYIHKWTLPIVTAVICSTTITKTIILQR